MNSIKLPYPLPPKHKSQKQSDWKRAGLIVSDEEFETIYNKYIIATHCELDACKKKFKSNYGRHMEHNHHTGEYRNIVCSSCNMRKYDVKMKSSNTSGYSGITKSKSSQTKQGFYWRFRAMVNGKNKCLKTSVDKDTVIEFADKWKIDNNYHT